MKKGLGLAVYLLITLLCVTALADVAISKENFPDGNFRAYVRDLCDTDGNGTLSDSEIDAVFSISCGSPDSPVSSLKGIEYFTNLMELNCTENQLTSLDLSGNTHLIMLNCGLNRLTSLNLSQNTELETLLCSGNRLTSLNVSRNTALLGLFCDNNQLKNLDVSGNTALTELYCGSNRLTSLDVSGNTALTVLDCSSNQLAELDVSGNPDLIGLSCASNRLTGLNVSKNTELTGLYCNSNRLTSLNVSRNAKLEKLECARNQLKQLDVSGIPAIVQLVQAGEKTETDGVWTWESYEDGYICLQTDSGVRLITDGSGEIPVSSVKLNKTKASLSITLEKPNPTLKLKATVSPDDAASKAVTWKSSNKKVATVSSSGKVTAQGTGTCRITATAKDGSKKKATCTITVTVDEVQDNTLKYSLNHEKKTATVTGPRKTSLQTVAVPGTVKANGKTYKVTAIAGKAFRGMTALKNFTVGKNLTTIGKSAFEGCAKLKKITVKSAKITKVGKNAFKNTSGEPSVYLSKEMKQSYINKLLKLLAAGGLKNVTPVIQ